MMIPIELGDVLTLSLVSQKSWVYWVSLSSAVSSALIQVYEVMALVLIELIVPLYCIFLSFDFSVKVK